MIQYNHIEKSGGVGFLGLLTLLLVFLKAMGLVDWSWGFVFLPIWILPAIALVAAAAWFIGWIALVSYQAQGAKKREKAKHALGS